MAALAQVTGLGWGWIKGLSNPGAARMWLDVPTGLGLFFGKVLSFIGFHGMTTEAVALTRTLGLVVVAAVVLYLLTHCDSIGLVRALGLSLLVVAILGPAVQPWYLTWGIILMAPVVTGRLRILVLGLSIVAPFIGIKLIDMLLVAVGMG